jgi:hypothetical protein
MPLMSTLIQTLKKKIKIKNDDMPPPRYLKSVPIEAPVLKENLMSIFTVIDKDAKAVVSKIGAAFKKLWSEEPKVEAVASQIISGIAPTIVAVASVVSGAPGGAAAGAIISEVKVGLAAVQAALNSAGAGAATSASTVLNALVTNLNSLLAVADIKDAAVVATVSKDVDEIVAGLQILIASL